MPCSRGCFSETGRQLAGKRQGEELAGNRAESRSISTRSLLCAPAGTDTKIISSSAAYENSLVKQHDSLAAMSAAQPNRGEPDGTSSVGVFILPRAPLTDPRVFFDPISNHAANNRINPPRIRFNTPLRSFYERTEFERFLLRLILGNDERMSNENYQVAGKYFANRSLFR